jgi:NTP pyrophosphatase (non-canonical NTP hydrolase)
MPRKMTVQELVNETALLRKRLQERESRPWTIEAYTVELLAEVGTLADSIMIKEGYRRIRADDNLDLEDDISDILFILISIATHYGIDLEKAYRNMIKKHGEKLDKI